MSLSTDSTLATNPEYSCWVNAGAGTGKTKILVDRVLRLILYGVDFDKILCLTFTNAAANEMQERIIQSLKQWSVQNKKELTESLINLLCRTPTLLEVEKASRLFSIYCASTEKVRIHTIHAFCQYMLKIFAIEADLSPNFRIMTEIQKKNILYAIRIRTINNIENISPNIANSIRYFVDNTHDVKLHELFESIIENKKKFLYMFKKLEFCELYEYYLRTKFGLKNEEDLMQKLDVILNKIGYIEFKPKVQLDQKFVHTFNKFLDEGNFFNLSLQEKTSQLNVLREILFTKTGEPRKRIFSNEFVKINSITAELIYELQCLILSIFDNAKQKRIVEISCHLFNLGKHILSEYKAICKDENLLDYDDLIINAKNLLTDSSMKDWILYKLDGGIEHILLDEAQDTSLDQWEIIDALILDFFSEISEVSEKHKTIFVVGDEKQSIYSFQGAELNNFFYYKNKISSLVLNAGKKFADITLSINYRSTKPILSTVAHVFSRFKEDYKDIFVESNINLSCARENTAGYVTCLSVESMDVLEDEFWPKRPINNENTNRHVLAKNIAEYIKSLISSRIIIPATNKPIDLGDIMILVRKRDKFVHILNKELQKFNLHTSGFDRFLLKDNLAVLDLISIGKFVLQPLDDLNLACLLKSSIINLDDETLHYISSPRKKSLWEEISGNMFFQKIYSRLHELKTIGESLVLNNFFHTFVDKLCLRPNLASIDYESEYAVNIFLNLAYSFSLEETNNLADFISWFEKNEVEVKRNIDSKNKISIMTIHGSKGLQAPIVILAEHANHRNTPETFLWNEDNVVVWNASVQESAGYILQLKDEYSLNLTKESMRLLYVAITRAQDGFIFFGITKKKGTDQDSKTESDTNNETEMLEANFDSESKVKSWFQPFQKYFLELSKNNNLYSYLEFPKSSEKINTAEDERMIQKDLENLEHLTSFNLEKKPAQQKNKYSSPLNSSVAILYGQVAHKILEDCVLNPSLIEHHKALSELPENTSNKLKKDLIAVFNIDEFKSMLKHSVYTEVGVISKTGMSELSVGRIDFVSISSEEVFIVDYKTDSNPEEADVSEYVSQLSCYKDAMQKIHPNLKVSCYILWISRSELQKITIN